MNEIEIYNKVEELAQLIRDGKFDVTKYPDSYAESSCGKAIEHNGMALLINHFSEDEHRIDIYTSKDGGCDASICIGYDSFEDIRHQPDLISVFYAMSSYDYINAQY